MNDGALIGTSGGVDHAKVSVAFENERPTRLCCFPNALSKDHGREAGVGEDVEVFADGVKGYKVLDIQMFGHFKRQIRVLEEGFEDAEFAQVKLRGWWGRGGKPEGRGATLAQGRC